MEVLTDCHPVTARGRVRLSKPSPTACIRIEGDLIGTDSGMGLGRYRRADGLIVGTARKDLIRCAKFLSEHYRLEVVIDSPEYQGTVPAATWVHEQWTRDRLAVRS